ncbi:unnamed protein product [Schistosoma mattheei]|uniref:Small ribosomal subunit protein uS5m N-terminal domain-containing protein n=1 Tax=Schistosoma mattheei TaxID=31246 RepID=A0A183NL33_9TREM|nr:unnamed protein product [Schistosoma mattheei]
MIYGIVKDASVGDYNEEYFERLEMLRNKSAVKKKRMKLTPLQRGWTGKLLGGQSVGSPTPNNPDFDCFVIESKVNSFFQKK